MINFQIIASGSAGNCYHLSSGENSLLIECGIAWKRIQRALDFKTSGLDGCITTHHHKDHSRAIRDVARAGIDVYAPRDTFKHYKIKNHRTYTAYNLKQFSIGGWNILPFKVVHDCPSFGYLVSIENKKLLYATDTAYIRYQFKGLTHIAIECNFQTKLLKRNVKNKVIPRFVQRRVNRNHFSLDRVLDFLKATDLSNVEKIYLLHISKNNADPAEMKRAVQSLTGKQVVCSV